METLGLWLRQAREARDETLEEAQAATHIRVRFLEMLEEGEFKALPGGEVQALGFLRLYARHLGLSPDEAIARLKSTSRGPAPAPEAVPPQRQPAPSAQPRARAAAPPAPRAPHTATWLSLETLIVAAVLLIAVVVIIAGIVYLVNRNNQESSGSAPTIPSAMAATHPTVTREAQETPTSPPASPTFAVDPEGDVKLTLEATEHVWVRVTVDGMTAYQGLLGPGQTETWVGSEAVIVDTGNGAGLLAIINEQDQGPLGERAQICIRGWGPEGEIAVQ